MYLSFWLTIGAGLVVLALVVVAAHIGSVLAIAVIAFSVFAVVELIEGWREGRIMGPLVARATSDSAASYSVAAAVMSPVVALTTVRLVNERPLERRTLMWSCVCRGGVMAVLVVIYALTLGADGTRF